MLESQAGFNERAKEQAFIRTLSGYENLFGQGAEAVIILLDPAAHELADLITESLPLDGEEKVTQGDELLSIVARPDNLQRAALIADNVESDKIDVKKLAECPMESLLQLEVLDRPLGKREGNPDIADGQVHDGSHCRSIDSEVRVKEKTINEIGILREEHLRIGRRIVCADRSVITGNGSPGQQFMTMRWRWLCRCSLGCSRLLTVCQSKC
jgi:hypothetical protein